MKFRETFRNLLIGAGLLASTLASAAPVQLRFVVWDGDESIRKALRPAIADFEKNHPGIKVKLEAVDYAQYFTKLLSQYAAGVAPDVAMMNPEFFQRYAKRGALLELNQFYDQVPGFNIKDYYKEIVDAHSLDGKLYVLPRDIAPIAVVYYNKRLFREAGIPYPDGTWTWDWEVRPELKEKDFLWVMQQLTKKGPNGRPTQWGYAPGWQGLFTDMVYLSTGHRIADDYKAPKEIRWNDPGIIRAFQFSADLTLKQRFMPSAVDIQSQNTSSRLLFTQQKVAMFQSGIWEVPEMRKALVKGDPGYFDWDIALAPGYKDGTRAYPTGGSGYCILKSTPHPKEAWLLTQWMAGAPGMKAMAVAGVAQPAIRKQALAEPWIPGPNTPEEQQVPQNRIITDQAVPYVVFSPSAIYWNEVSTIAQQTHSRVYDGTSTAKVELVNGNTRAQNRMDTLLREETLPPYNWAIAAVVFVAIVAILIAWIYAPEFRRKLSHRQREENRTAYIFIAPWILGILFFTLGPMILSLLMSFADWDIIRAARWRGVGNYVEAFSIDPTFWISLRVTIIYTLIAVPIGIISSLSLALLLNVKVKGMPLWRTCYYIPSVASGVASALIWMQVFKVEGGLLNSLIYGPSGGGNFLGLATALKPLATANGQINWLGSETMALPSMMLMSVWGAGGGMVIMLAGLQGVPTFFYEAATLDGAGAWNKFKAVTLPLISPTLFFNLVTGFIGAFQVFTQALLMTNGGPNNSTMFFNLYLFNNAMVNLRMGYASSLAWVLFFVILGFTVFQFKASKWVYYEGAK
ncbi:MAG: extracellular solute-binding protein [Fimbriimonas sp.]